MIVSVGGGGGFSGGGGAGGSVFLCGGSGGGGGVGSFYNVVDQHNLAAQMFGRAHGHGQVQVVDLSTRRRSEPDEDFECDYSLSRRTADYCKWGMRA